MTSCSSVSDSYSGIVKKVLLQVEHDEQFSLDTPQAIAGLHRTPSRILVERVKRAGHKSFATTESKLWQARSSWLKEIWNELWLALRGDEGFKEDPLLMTQNYLRSSLGLVSCPTRDQDLVLGLSLPL